MCELKSLIHAVRSVLISFVQKVLVIWWLPDDWCFNTSMKPYMCVCVCNIGSATDTKSNNLRNGIFLFAYCVAAFHVFFSSSATFALLMGGGWGCFINVSRALQNILSKFVYWRNRIPYETFKLKLCTCAQSHALGARTKFKRETLAMNMPSGIVYFLEIVFKSSQNVSETTPWKQWDVDYFNVIQPSSSVWLKVRNYTLWNNATLRR